MPARSAHTNRTEKLAKKHKQIVDALASKPKTGTVLVDDPQPSTYEERSMKERTYKIQGVAPLIIHNARLSDPLDKWAKLVAEITRKKKKTEADLMEMARREWFGGLYLNDAGKVVIPGSNLERMIRDAATKSKMGMQVQAGVIIPEFDGFVLKFPDNGKKMDTLWANGSHSLRASCKLRQSRVIRTRPCFLTWALEFTVQFDEELLNPKQIDEFVVLAGRIIGLGDWRPKYGRFVMESAA